MDEMCVHDILRTYCASELLRKVITITSAPRRMTLPTTAASVAAGGVRKIRHSVIIIVRHSGVDVYGRNPEYRILASLEAKYPLTSGPNDIIIM